MNSAVDWLLFCVAYLFFIVALAYFLAWWFNRD